MPFDFKKFDAKCANMSAEELQREWEHYTRLISGAATSTAVSGAAIPLTLGVSMIGVGLAAPAIHNARKKREIIERHLQTRGTTHNTRKRDILGPMAISGSVGILTLGVGSVGADAIANAGAEHGISAIVENDLAVKAGTHLALDVAAMKVEDVHAKSKKESEAFEALQKASTLNEKVAETAMSAPSYPIYNPHYSQHYTQPYNQQHNQQYTQPYNQQYNPQHNPQLLYGPLPIPQSYAVNSNPDFKSSDQGEKISTYYPQHVQPLPSNTATSAAQNSPPSYPGPPIQSPPMVHVSNSDAPPPPRPVESTMSTHISTPAHTPDPKSPLPSQAAPSYSPIALAEPFSGKFESCIQHTNAAHYYYPQPAPINDNQKSPQLTHPTTNSIQSPASSDGSYAGLPSQNEGIRTNYDQLPPARVMNPHIEQRSHPPSREPLHYCPPPMNTYASYPGTMLPAGHPGQPAFYTGSAPQQTHTRPMSTILPPPPSLTQPQYQSPEPETVVTYRSAPMSNFASPPPSQQGIPYFPPPPGNPSTTASSPHPGPRQTPNFQLPPQQQPFSPPATPFSPAIPNSQLDGYFSHPSPYCPPALPSYTPLHSYQTPASTPYTEYPPEKQQHLQHPSTTHQMFPPPPVSPYSYPPQY